MADKDYYKTLGVEKGSTKEDIKKAYKKLAMKYHPDRAPDDKKKDYEEKFKEISVAAAVLSDDKKRQQYDQFGSQSFQQGGAGSGFEGYDFSDIMSQFRSGGFGNFDDLFDHVFGGSERRGHGRRGSDLAYEMEITLEEAFHGASKNINLNKLEKCSDCKGKGATKFENCHHCQGSGFMQRTQRTPFGIFSQRGPCPYCKGQGQLPQDSCKNCGGDGLLRRKKSIEVTIPAGIDEGMRLRIKGEGEVGDVNGDLYVIIHIAEHEFFKRDGENLHITIPISYTQAVLGDEIEVPTIDGKAVLKIPSGTDSETVFRMREKGLPNLRGSESGDQMVKVKIEVPKKLSKKQSELLREMKEEKPAEGLFKRLFG